MKKSKAFLTAIILFVAAFMFMGCDTNQSLMDTLIHEADSFNKVSESYDSGNDNSFTNIQLSAMNNREYDTIELTVSDDLVSFNEMRLDLISIHEEILVEIDTIKNLFDSIQTKANILSEKEYVLLQGDKDLIQEDILTIKEYKAGLLETQGQAYARVFDQEYTRENLTDILIMFDEVYAVLEYRLDTLKLAIIELENIDSILSDYMES